MLIAFTEGMELAIDIEVRSVTSAILYKSAWAIWSVVTESAQAIGIGRFGAHDLRRTCANVWSAALSQAKSDLIGWSAQMYLTFGGVYDSWPGWNALRPLPI